MSRRPYTIEVHGARRRDNFRLVRGRRRIPTGMLVTLLLLGWYGWQRAVAYVHVHEAAINRGFAIGVPLLLAAVFAAVGLILWLGGRRRNAAQRKADEVALALDAYTPNSDGVAFEEQVAALLRRDGLEDVERRGGSGDLGADVVGWWRKGVEPVFVVVQCKAYNPTSFVGSKDVQAFAGTVYSVHEADVAVFVTTAANFHPGALKVAQANGIYLVASEQYGRTLAGAPLVPDSLLHMAAEQLAREHGAEQQTAPLPIAPAAEEATA